ncbi:MAG TPA: hypothetical protein VGB15_09220 [Longimicrobium sp.]|jgi:hypothetical protein
MKKLALTMDELAVDSFTTEEPKEDRGMVKAQECGPTAPSCRSLDLNCLTEERCPTDDCPTSSTTICRC